MNLELLDPFRRQVPDRIDSTLSLPESLLPQPEQSTGKKTSEKNPPKPPPPIAAQHLAFNRRGNYVAVGYANGLVAVYDTLSRTVSSVYRMKIPNDDYSGITALSWSRRSRTLLVGSLANERVMLIDATHPQGPKECGATSNIHVPIPKSSKKDSKKNSKKDNDDEDDEEEKERMSPAMGTSTLDNQGNKNLQQSSFATMTRKELDQQLQNPRHIETNRVLTQKVVDGTTTPSSPTTRRGLEPLVQAVQSNPATRRYPSVFFDMPYLLGATLQVHPKHSLMGQAVLQDGSLVVFNVPSAAFEESAMEPKAVVSTVFVEKEYFLTCSCLDPHGDKLYAGTQDGKLLGFDAKELWNRLGSGDDNPVIPSLQPSFVISVPGGASIWNMVVSRNGKAIVLNSADAALRYYITTDCWTVPEEVEKPQFVFQDVVNKVKFGSCDISGDGEYVAGGAQGADTKYEVYIWNTSTGVLAEKLTGSPVDLFSVAWQPTRSFLAVAASDGLVDVWGPRINWTAFAPDFQALPHNVEYVEREDEFDVVVASDTDNGTKGKNEEDEEEKVHVDILTLHKIPVFQSDSEDEEDVFHFDVVRKPTGSAP